MKSDKEVGLWTWATRRRWYLFGFIWNKTGYHWRDCGEDGVWAYVRIWPFLLMRYPRKTWDPKYDMGLDMMPRKKDARRTSDHHHDPDQ